MSQAESIDYLVIGAGVAGLRAAIELADHGQVLVVTKESLGESNTHYAQGGIAVALSGEEDVALHLQDTEYAGDGLVHRPAAEILVTEGPQRVEELIQWGTQFDRGKEEGKLLLAREAAHSLPRILHAHGDATGAEISRALLATAKQHPRIRFADWTMIANLVVEDHRAVAADLFSLEKQGGLEKQGRESVDPNSLQRIRARAILIASGGAGQVYSDTTNPAVATGDGIALAAQAGAELADMEFYQFHPTALSIPGVPRFLLSEALRGEGAYLRNDRGERFMERYHPQLELAPRDVVARAIAREGMGEQPGETREVYLDMRHVSKEASGGVDLNHRFPGISRFLGAHGLSLHRDLIPVRPAAHYLMGGIRTDLSGRTTLKGLYAAGEAACTGVHGANRLASNSLLEGLVFGARAAKAILADELDVPAADTLESAITLLETSEAALVEALITQLQRTMWAHAGLLRQASTLQQGIAEREAVELSLDRFAQQGKASRRLFEARALASIAHSIQSAALARTESRGAHYRNDYPKHDDENFLKHSVELNHQIYFEQW
jgi:L-aspartate oxidase